MSENSVNESGKTALHLAAKRNDLLKVNQLLSSGADVHAKDKCRETPLHEVAWSTVGESHFEVAEVLLKNEADVDAIDSSRYTPLKCLLFKGNLKMVHLFLKFTKLNVKTNCNLLNAAAFYKNFEVVQFLIDLGFDVNGVHDYQTPLHSACRPIEESNLKIVKFFMRHGADVNSNVYHSLTPIMVATHEWCRRGSCGKLLEKELQFLLKHTKFSINHVDIDELKYNKIQYPLPPWIWKMVIKHIAMLHALKVPVHQKFLKSILGKNEYNGYYQKCDEELSLAKSTKLKNSWITFYNLLVDGRRKLKNYAGNSDLIEDFENSDCKKKFPLYGATISENVKKGIRRREFYDKSAVVLSDCMPIFNPSHLIVRDVLDCILSKKLLSTFSESNNKSKLH